MARDPENSQNPASPDINAMEEEPQEFASSNTASPEEPENPENSEDINAIEYMEEEGAEPEEPQDQQKPREPEEPPEEPGTSTDQGFAENSEVRNAGMLHGTRRTSAMKPTRPARSSVTKLSRATQTIYMRQQITGQPHRTRNQSPGTEFLQSSQLGLASSLEFVMEALKSDEFI